MHSPIVQGMRSCFGPFTPTDRSSFGNFDEVNTATVMHKLKFFIPAFIWNFNRCKLGLVNLDLKVAELQKTLAENELALCHFKGESADSAPPSTFTFPSFQERFRLGTARELRVKQLIQLDNPTSLLSRPESMREAADNTVSPEPWQHPDSKWFFCDLIISRPKGIATSHGASSRKHARSSLAIAPPGSGARARGKASSHTQARAAIGRRAGFDTRRTAGSSTTQSKMDYKRTLSLLIFWIHAYSPVIPYKAYQSQVTIDAIESVIIDKKASLSSALKKRGELLGRFNIHRKCLQILLDEKLCRATLLEDTIIRVLTDSSTRSGGEMSEALESLQQLLASADELSSLGKSEESTDTTDGPSISLLMTDAYYDNGETYVEALVDEYMAGNVRQLKEQGQDCRYNQDIHILLAQMEKMNPVIRSDFDEGAQA